MIEETQYFFSTTNYMAKKSRKLREMNGVMSVPQKISKGRKLSGVLKAEVAAFYESDEVSQLCPGRNDSVSIRLPNGEKGRKQKRLVLANSKSCTALSRSLTQIKKCGFQLLPYFVHNGVF